MDAATLRIHGKPVSIDFSRPREQRGQSQNPPNTTLMVRGMTHPLTRPALVECFAAFAPVADVRLVYERGTNDLRDFCFVDMTTLDGARKVVESVGRHGLPLAGNMLSVSYARVGFDDRFRGNSGVGGGARKNNAVASAAIAAAMGLACQQRPPAYTTNRVPAIPAVPPGHPPLAFDTTSGYYYHPGTGFYFMNGYYYDGSTQKYHMWDVAQQTMVPYEQAQTTPQQTQDRAEKVAKKKKKTQKAALLNKQAKKIANDMKRWAKQAKSKKTSATTAAPTPATKGTWVNVGSEPANDQNHSEQVQNPPPCLNYTALDNNDTMLVAATEAGHIRAVKAQCLLCQRQLSDTSQLVEHLRKSELHETNMRAEREARLAAMTEAELEEFECLERNLLYRDRAAERRKHFGQPNYPTPLLRTRHRAPAKSEAAARSAAAPPPVTQATTSNSLDASNKGFRMLKSLGWQPGQSLGKNESKGVTVPVQARGMIQRGVGLAVGKVVDGGPPGKTASTYKEHARLLTLARYKASGGGGE